MQGSRWQKKRQGMGGSETVPKFDLSAASLGLELFKFNKYALSTWNIPSLPSAVGRSCTLMGLTSWWANRNANVNVPVSKIISEDGHCLMKLQQGNVVEGPGREEGGGTAFNSINSQGPEEEEAAS